MFFLLQVTLSLAVLICAVGSTSSDVINIGSVLVHFRGLKHPDGEDKFEAMGKKKLGLGL